MIKQDYASRQGGTMEKQTQKSAVVNRGEIPIEEINADSSGQTAEPGNLSQIKKVLLVEDSEVSRYLLKEILEIKGYSVTIAENGVQAIGYLNSYRFDVVLLDLGLPLVDGFEIAAFLKDKNDSGYYRPQIIALTGRSRESDRQACREKGIDIIINKADGHKAVIAALEGRMDSPICGEESPGQEDRTDGPLDPGHFLSSVNNDMQIFKTVIRVFFNNYPQWLSEATDAIFQKDNIKLAQLAHKMKGTIAHFEIGPIFQAAEKLETAAGDGDWEMSRRLFACLQIGMEEMERRLIQYLGDGDADSCDR